MIPEPTVLDSLQLTILTTRRTTVTREWDIEGVQRDPFARLYLVEGGRGRLIVDGESIDLEAGSCCLIPENSAIAFCEGRGLTHVWVHFVARVAGAVPLWLLFDPPRVFAAGVCGAGSSNTGRRAVLPNDGVGGEAASLFREVMDRSEGGPVDRFAACTALRRLLEPFLAAAHLRDGAESFQRIVPVARYIREHLGDSLRVSNLAGLAGLHPTYFSDRFAAAIGQTPSVYVRARRVEAAQLMLLNTNLPIKAIARSCGYADVAYFHRVFRAGTGTTPKAYRDRGIV
jgi:AraC-like DNA-binding protein